MDPDSLLHALRKALLDTLRHPNQTPATDPTQVPPPPAYSPTDLPTSAPLALPNVGTQPYPTGVLDNDDDDDLPPPPQPPITIKIDSSTKIIGHGNVLTHSPTESATRVAAMLVAALRQTKALEGGESRPVEISVGAGVSVVGCRNVVGTTGVKGKGADGEARGMKEGVEGGGGSGRKRGAEGDLAQEMPRAKKAEMCDG